ncbi:hypothetical protein [Microbacterium sp. C448]|uniref:hypothetical protein n=1 Tax=Microbacterium sp. C448 TaxID=1177594 RepID=UPI001182E1CB|nr:hypothetical protein [Microbacterium sp. C448]
MSAALLTACASTGGSEEPSGGSTSLGGGGGVSNSTFEQDLAAWTEKFDSCLRDEGIDVPKRTSGEMLDLDSLGVDEATYKAASATCSKKVGPVPVDPSAPSADEDYQMQLTFAKCMRDAGYEWDDPAPPSEAGSAGVKPIDPGKFDQKDMDACAVKAGLDAGSGNG